MKKLLFILCMFCTLFANAQAGSIDTSFNPTDVGFGKGDGANNQVFSSVIQPDGKMIIAGSFSTYNGTSVNRICRLNTDGNLDPTFVVGTGASSTINSIALQPDGKIIIAGDFNNYNGIAREKIARLNSDGSLDTTFTVGNGASDTVRALAVQTDGKIIIGGRFSMFNNLNNRGIVRLNTNGSVDTGFSSAEKPNGDVNALAIQTDGKILVGGSFSTYNSIARSNIARINADGTLDTGFTPGTGASSVVYVIKMQSDGKILIGGEFTQYNGVANNRIARLQNNGTLDTAFTTGTAASSTVRAIHMLSDGKIVIGGDFVQYNGVNNSYIGLLNNNGVLDTTFASGTGLSSSVYTIAQQADEKIVVGGSFTTYNERHAPRVVRISTNGAMDTTYNVVSGFNNSVSASVQQTDGKIIVCGGFNNYFNVPTSSLLRLNIDGTVDTSFSTGTGFNRFANANKLALQPDGKIIVIGNFTSYNGLPYNQAVRINTDGTVDTTFNIGTGLNNGSVNNLVVQPDGKIIIVGMFTNFNGFNINRIVRLNSDGSRDTTFNPGSGPEWFTNVVRLQTDGKIIIGGNFGNYNNITSGGIARLNANGSLDTTFAVGTGFNDPNGISIQTLQIQPDGKIIAAGNFPRYKTTAINRIARLNTDGTLDTTFTVGTGANSQIFSSALQADGKVILGGQFTTYNAVNINRLMRLNTDGTLDTTFNVGTGLDQTPFSATLLSDGKLLIGGAFIGYNGNGRNRLARVNTSVHAPVASATQTICGSGTLANLSVVGTNIKWYNAATAGVLLASNTTVVNNTTYFASQTVGGIESVSRTSVLVTLNPLPVAPTAASAQTICNAGTVANLTTTSGTGIKWYPAATGGTALLPTAVLTATNYFASQTIGTCESVSRTSVLVTISAPTAPTAASAQTICNAGTVADLTTTSGTGIKWYAAATGGTALLPTAVLTATNYFASQTIGTCESVSRTGILVTIGTPAPTAVAQQFLSSGSTIANLTTTTGINIKWYATLTGGSVLAATTTLNSGNYFVSQTIGTCESARTQVTAIITAAARAINFDGTNDFMRVSNNPLLNFTTSMTVEFWVRRNANTSGDNFIIGKSTSNAWNNGYNVSFGGNGDVRFCPKGWSNGNISTTNPIPLNTWTHYAATYDGTTTNVYLNGVLTTSSTNFSGAIPTNALDLFIGSDNGVGTYFAKCDLDMVRLWNIARTQTEIASNRGNCIAASTTGLVAQYDFEEQAGSANFRDTSGNNLHGTYNNMEAADWIAGDTCGQAFLSVATNEFNATVKVYPNPSNSIFNLEIDTDATIQVFDMIGKQILTKKIQSGNAQIDLSNCEKGIYFMKITNVSNQQKTIKLMKQ